MTAMTVGSAAGNASIEVAASSTTGWTASTDAPWLHIPAEMASGTGNASIQFSYDANPGNGSRSGTLSIGDQVLLVTQAGSTYTPVNGVTTAAIQGLSKPFAVALDAVGNLYIADAWNNVISEWSPATQQITTLVSSGLNRPHGLAVDSQGNIYIADTYNNAIEEWNPATQQMTTLVSAGLNAPMGVAVDSAGNVYIADYGNNAVEQWNSSTSVLNTLVTGLSHPTGVAVDILGNVYIADFGNNAVRQWNAATQQLSTVLAAGLSYPNALAVDGQGNVYVVDGNYNALIEWNSAAQTAGALLTSGMEGSFGVATDGQGNFYIANTSTSSILEFSTGSFGLLNTNVSEGPQGGIDSVAVQLLGGSVIVSASSDQPWLTITGATASSISFSFLANPSPASRVAHITVLGQQITVTQLGDTAASMVKTAGDGETTSVGQAFPIPLQVTITDAAGYPIQGVLVNFQVTPGASGAAAQFASTPATAVTDTNGNATAPTLTANNIPGQFTATATGGGLTAVFTLTNISYTLGANSALVGSEGGSGTVLLNANGPWNASSNVSWLTLADGSTSGTGSAIIQFNYTTNFNLVPQTGILAIAGLSFVVTQAGSGYIPTPVITTLAAGLDGPRGLALDPQGDVYIAETGANDIKEWVAATQQVGVVLATGLNSPAGVTLDSQGNIFIADTGNGAIEQWSAATGLATLVPGLSNPLGVATDQLGNVYFSDTGHNLVGEWNASSGQVSTLAGTGLSGPGGIAVDSIGDVDFADTGSNAIDQWNAAGQTSTALISSGLSAPLAVAADGQGNLYIADTGNNAVKRWNAATQQVITIVSSGLNGPSGLAVDAQSNVYISDTNNGAIRKFTQAYVALDYLSRIEGAAAGSDALAVQVLPANTPLSATSDQSWLTITGIAGGVISFSYAANSSANNRTAHITVLGQQVTLTQSGDAPSFIVKSAGDGQSIAVGQAYPAPLQVTVTDTAGLPVSGATVTFTVVTGSSGATGAFGSASTASVLTDQNGLATAPVLTANSTAGAFTVNASINGLSVTFNLTVLVYSLEANNANVGSGAGSGAVWLLASGQWSVTSNASWLQVAAGSASGTGNALIQYTYSANTDTAVRSANLNISGLNYAVTQANSSYESIMLSKTLVASGIKGPQAVAVDSLGNVYIADTLNNAIKKWTATTGILSTLVSGLNSPQGVAVDSQGDVFFTDSKNNAVKEWMASKQSVVSLVSTGLSVPMGGAVDALGNFYFADYGHNAIKEWIAATQKVVTLVSGLNGPSGVAVDPLSNVYFADSKNNAIKEWIAASNKTVTLVSSGLSAPHGVALDSASNLYIADTNNNAIKQWSPATQQVSILVNSSLKTPTGVAVDNLGNIYVADTGDSAIKQYTPGFFALGATSLSEVAQAGTDSVTAPTIPSNLPMTASSNATWLQITGTSGGVISFSFTANTSATSRTAQITVFGQTITVTQNYDVPASMTIAAGNNQSTSIGRAFTTALQVKVLDAQNKPVSGSPVTFTVTPGSNGAGATFASSTPVSTNSNGLATASKLTANNIAGSFTVTATDGTISVVFSLRSH
ncbi:MAG TPA: BACON domain-containing carbohydrate-binding protein [Bryobacteraceae bacterium]|nr:BACON domain-containing carbohydrate-binding protein [Bryobacteraceae bacterium]